MKTARALTNAAGAVSMRRFWLGRVCDVGLLGRWRPISGHIRHARLANSLGSDGRAANRSELDSPSSKRVLHELSRPKQAKASIQRWGALLPVGLRRRQVQVEAPIGLLDGALEQLHQAVQQRGVEREEDALALGRE